MTLALAALGRVALGWRRNRLTATPPAAASIGRGGPADQGRLGTSQAIEEMRGEPRHLAHDPEDPGVSVGGAEHRPRRAARRRPRLVVQGAALTAWVLILIAISIALWHGWNLYHSTTNSASRPPYQGAIRVYFDRPVSSATIDASIAVSSYFPARTEFYVYLSLDETVNEPIGFSLLVTGDAIPDASPLKEYEDDRRDDGCIESVSSTANDLNCFSLQTDPDGLGDTANPDTTGEYISGTIVPTSSGFAYGTVTMYSNSEIEISDSERSYFRLPDIGTAYIPIEDRSRLGLRFGSQVRYIPNAVTTRVKYRALAASERLEFASPSIASPGELSWVDTRSSEVEASGAIIDVDKSKSVENDLFIAGLLVAFGTAFAPMALERLAARVSGLIALRRPEEANVHGAHTTSVSKAEGSDNSTESS